MPDFLLYWRRDTAARRANEAHIPIEYAASNQLDNRVRPADTLWLVTSDSGRLSLIGRIEVDAVVDKPTAEQRLPSTDLWDAQWYAIAREGTAEAQRSLDITAIASSLRFRTKQAPALSVEGGRVNPQQLQTMRSLSSDSARVLQRLWGAPKWELQPGHRIKRVDLHLRFGGRAQGGIGPSTKSPNVFLFSDPASGEQHGYFDGWRDDGLYHYTGEGQRGDQTMVQGNATILRHVEDGRALRLFNGSGGEVEYVGEFEIDQQRPHYLTDAPETGGGPVRQVVVFRLRLLDGTAPPPSEVSIRAHEGTRVVEVEIELQHTERYVVQPSAEPVEADRREQRLVLKYKAYLESKGFRVTRQCCWPEGEAKPLYTDLFNATQNQLIETKGTATREAVRMALGQLLDYRRFLQPLPAMALLTPHRPRPDLEALLREHSIACIWASDAGAFVDNADGIFA